MLINDELRFHISDLSVGGLSMARLGDYLIQLANLLGEKDRLHFNSLEEGSVIVVANIEPVSVPKVLERTQSLSRGNAPADVFKAFNKLNDMLAEDNASGQLTLGSNPSNAIEFPGCNNPKPILYGPFWEQGSLDGQLIKVGGKDSTVPVHLLDDGGNVFHCTTTRELSKSISVHYLGGALRVKGRGKWMRESTGSWILEEFIIEGFEQLDDSPLSKTVKRLRSVEGSKWSEFPDPLRELAKLRGDGRKSH